ncbi:MAG: PQQ-binding-like beta-propeller repeat protein [Solirubrobacteraceae bacterium]
MARNLLATAATLMLVLLPVAARAQLPVSVTLPPPPVVVPAEPGPESPTLGGDAAHRNAWNGSGLRPPLEVAWSTPAETIYAAVAVAGRVVYQTATELVAVDGATGRALWRLPLDAAARPAEVATDGGRVYVTGPQGVAAFDAATGTLRWAVAAPGGSVGPVVAAGILYTGRASGRVTAYQASSGRVLWDVAVPIAGARPAVSGQRLFLTGTCSAAALNAATGAGIWGTSSCTPRNVTDGGTRTILTGRAVLSEDFGLYAAQDGRRVSPDRSPGTVGGGLTFRSPLLTPAATDLVATDAATGATRWTFAQRRLEPAEPATLLLRPAVTDGLVWQLVDTGSNGLRLTALDAATGAGRYGAFLPGAGELDPRLTTALAVSPGLMLVPAAGGGLLALRNAPAGPLGVTATLPKNVVTARESTVVKGRLVSDGHGLTGPRPVRLEQDAFPFDRRYTRVGDARPGSSGRFSVTAAVERNTRFRLVADGVRYPPTTVYARPVISAVFARTSRHRMVRATVRIRADKRFDRAGTVAIYRLRRGATVLQRIGTGRSSRGGTARFTVTIPANLRRTDKIVPCLRGASRKGFGPSNVLDRRCGDARVPVQAASAARLSRSAGTGSEIPLSRLWPASEKP